MAWTGRDQQHHLNMMASRDGGLTWDSKVTFEDTSVAVPSLAWSSNKLVLGWTGTDAPHHSNLAHIVVLM